MKPSSESFPRARFGAVPEQPVRDDGGQQGRGDREQLPQGSGYVLGVLYGLALWALVVGGLRVGGWLS